MEQKIAIGTTTTTFEPETEINREMLVTFLYRYARFLKLDLSEGDLGGYAVREEISEYACSAFVWAVKQGIVKGTDLPHLSPKDTATRAECATVLTRFVRWNEENAESKPTEPEDEKKNPADVTYEEYLAMSRKEQVAHMESVESVEVFFEWYHAAETEPENCR